jgi:hypothetical protein
MSVPSFDPYLYGFDQKQGNPKNISGLWSFFLWPGVGYPLFLDTYSSCIYIYIIIEYVSPSMAYASSYSQKASTS